MNMEQVQSFELDVLLTGGTGTDAHDPIDPWSPSEDEPTTPEVTDPIDPFSPGEESSSSN